MDRDQLADLFYALILTDATSEYEIERAISLVHRESCVLIGTAGIPEPRDARLDLRMKALAARFLR